MIFKEMIRFSRKKGALGFSEGFVKELMSDLPL